MERSSFFNAILDIEGVPDRSYLAEDYARYFASFIGNGVFPNPSSNLQVVANNDMTVTIKKGMAWINGYFYENTDDLIMQLNVADGVLNRIDRVVLRYDTADREIRVEVKKGTFASSPVAPLLQRDADAYELAIADIAVNRGIISITQANITDLRFNKELCGIVKGVVDEIDTTDLFAQYNDSFNIWFDTVKDIVNDTAVGSIVKALDEHASNNEIHITPEAKNNWDSIVKIKRNITILQSAWTIYTVNRDLWIYQIPDDDISQHTMVDVNIHLEDLDKAKHIKSSSRSAVGRVQLFATEKPREDIKCDIKIVKQVV